MVLDRPEGGKEEDTVLGDNGGGGKKKGIGPEVKSGKSRKGRKTGLFPEP